MAISAEIPALTLLAPRPAAHAVRHLVRASWLEALRRNELVVVGLLLGIYALAALVLRVIGFESAEAARLVRGLGLELGGLLSALLVILTVGRQLPAELELRTIHPLLAKPVARETLLLGKALAGWLLGVAALVMFVGATMAITPAAADQSLLVLAAALVLKALALAMLTALTMLLVIALPPALAMLLAAVLALWGHFLANLIVQMAGGARWAGWAAGLIPDFNMLDLMQRYTDGGPLPAAVVLAGLLVYGLAWLCLLGWAAAQSFRRMPL